MKVLNAEYISQTERNREMYNRLILGDISVRNVFIENNTSLIDRVLGAFLRKFNGDADYLREDLRGEAALAVCQVIQGWTVEGGPIDLNPSDYLAVTVWNACQAFFWRERRWASNRCKLPSDEELAHLTGAEVFHSSDPSTALAEALEELLACCETDNERFVVTAYHAGSTTEEIATMAGKSASTIRRWARAVGGRMKTMQSSNADSADSTGTSGR